MILSFKINLMIQKINMSSQNKKMKIYWKKQKFKILIYLNYKINLMIWKVNMSSQNKKMKIYKKKKKN